MLTRPLAVGASVLAAVLGFFALFVFALASPAAAQVPGQPVDPVGSDLGLGITWLTLIVAITKFVGLVKSVKAADWNSVATLLVAILTGIGLVFLVSNSDFTDFTVPGLAVPLADAKGGTLVLIGIVLGLAAAYGRDFLKARDNTASTLEPPLIE